MTVPVGPVTAGTGGAVPSEALEAARAADEKLGEATVVLSMGDLLGVTDAFVITHGRNTRQVRTLVDEIERRVTEAARMLRLESLLDRRPRSASVTSETDLDVLVLSQRQFNGLLQSVPTIGRKMLAAMANRLREADAVAYD